MSARSHGATIFHFEVKHIETYNDEQITQNVLVFLHCL